MRKDYQEYYLDVYGKIISMGGYLIEENQLDASFGINFDWKILFICEKYYGPSFLLLLVPPDGYRYEVGLLMNVISSINGKVYGLPTIKNQLNFLDEEKGEIFNNAQAYKQRYEQEVAKDVNNF